MEFLIDFTHHIAKCPKVHLVCDILRLKCTYPKWRSKDKRQIRNVIMIIIQAKDRDNIILLYNNQYVAK